MPRSRLCRACREFHDLDHAWPQACASHFGEVASKGPQIISDTIEPFRSMASGEIFSSKSRYRQDLKARGLIEVGNENVQQKRVELPSAREAIRQARQQLGY